MSLGVPTPPGESQEALRGALPGVSAFSQLASDVSRPGANPEGNVGLPHQMFTLYPLELAVGAPLSSAHPLGWRYLIDEPSLTGAPVVAAAEVLQDALGHRFSHVHHGQTALATRDALALAESLPEVRAGSYDLRMLRLPYASVDALWLKDNAGNDDILIPYLAKIRGVVPGRAYTAEALLSRVREFTQKRLRFNNSPQPR